MASPTSIASAIASSSQAVRITTFTPTITATAGSLYTLSVAASAPAKKAAAQSILDKGAHAPNVYDSADPIKLFIIQVVIIISLSRGLGFILRKLRQPAVISEVIGGLILGPSVMGRVPGFTNAIFPAASIPNLNLVANIGLVIFLFLVGLEADFSVFKKNTKPALAISIVGLIVPFALGAAVAKGIYDKFVDAESVDFGIFLLFIGTAMAITAFPVLARILLELKLLRNEVGLTTLAAGVGNDVVGWVLLALSVALANAGNGLTALYIILTGLGLCLLLWFVVKPLYQLAVRKSGSYEHGPTPLIMTLTFFLVFASAFVTDIIGIHAIFGSFLVGLIVIPHHKGFVPAMVEKLEDIVTILFIPIYFALSGLKTDLGLLNSGSIWGWCVCVVIVAFVAKFGSCAGVAKLFGFPLRESLAIGSLMACKGLVELIVLNVGLTAGILNNEVFAMFVVMALVTTFVTTPLTIAFYPESYWRPKMELGQSDRKDDPSHTTESPDNVRRAQEHFRNRFLVVLERLESLPSMMSFVRLLQPSADRPINKTATTSAASHVESTLDGKASDNGSVPALEKLDKEHVSPASPPISSPLTVNAFRLLALTERTSALLKASDAEMTKRGDSVLSIFSAFANLLHIPFSTSMVIAPEEEYVNAVTEQTIQKDADLLVIPWAAGASLTAEDDNGSVSRLESLFGQQAVERSPQYASFVRRLFLESPSDVALFLDGGASPDGLGSPCSTSTQHLYLPFHGGPDDRASLDFLMQLVANNSRLSATVTRFVKVADDMEESVSKTTSTGQNAPASPLSAVNQLTIGAGLGAQDTIYAGTGGTQHRMASDTADNLALARWFPSAMIENADEHTQSVLPEAATRVAFETVKTAYPLKASLEKLQEIQRSNHGILVITGRSRHSAPSHRVELERYLRDRAVAGSGVSSLGIAASSEVRKTLGDVASAVIVGGHAQSILVLQSAVPGRPAVKGKARKTV